MSFPTEFFCSIRILPSFSRRSMDDCIGFLSQSPSNLETINATFLSILPCFSSCSPCHSWFHNEVLFSFVCEKVLQFANWFPSLRKFPSKNILFEKQICQEIYDNQCLKHKETIEIVTEFNGDREDFFYTTDDSRPETFDETVMHVFIYTTTAIICTLRNSNWMCPLTFDQMLSS